MFLSDVSIKRPVFATILNLVLIVFGIFTYMKLRIDLIPSIDFPVVTINILYPGADPKTVEQKVLEPIEKVLNGLEGLDRSSSTAAPNMATTTLVFKLGVNASKAAQDVRDKLGTVQLPIEARAPLIYKLDIGAHPVLTLAFAKGKSDIDLASWAKDRIKPQLEQIEGVGSVDIIGSRAREFHILVDRSKLQTFGLSPTQIIQAIQGQSLDVPGGKIENSKEVIRIRTEGTVKTRQQIGQMVIPLRNGQNIRIEDVAKVEDTLENEVSYAAYNGSQALILEVRKQSGGNTVAVARAAKAKIEQINRTLPEGAQLTIALDTSTFIEGSLEGLKIDLALGALLAVVIVLFFLHDWRATFISAMAIPTAVIGAVIFIYAFGFTLNMITSMALTLSIGILVDDAIVVIENIYRRLQLGDPPGEAARKGTQEIGLAAIAITLSIVSVFGPVAFMEGIIGQFFFSFGITITAAVLLSLFVAFTLTPMLSSILLHSDSHERVPAFFKPIASALKATDHFYRNVLALALRNRGLVILGAVGVLILTVWLFRFVPVSFFPKQDDGNVSVKYTLVVGTSLTASKEQAGKVESWIREFPGVVSVITTVGSDRLQSPNYMSFSVKLVNKAQRSYSQYQFMERLRADMQRRYVKPGEILEISDQGMGGGGGKPITMMLLGNDNRELVRIGNELKAVLQTQPGVVDVTTSEPPNTDEYRLVVNHTRAADLGLNTLQIGQSVRSLFEGVKVAELESQGDSFDVILKLADADTQSATSLAGLSVPNQMGVPVSLTTVAQLIKAPAPSRIERYSGMRSLAVSANFTGQDLQKVTNFLEAETKKRVTNDVTYSVEGTSRMMRESIQSFITTLLLAVVLVYMVLAAQFESFLTPFVIMLSVTLAFVGAILGLLVIGREFSMFSMIGILLLVGIVTKNAILLIDFTLQRMRHGMSVHDALLDAGPIRLRPILMTTFAMIFGMLPTAIGHGDGGESRSPMAFCVIGGLITSTVLTLVVIPCVFSVMQSLKARIMGKHSEPEETLHDQVAAQHI